MESEVASPQLIAYLKENKYALDQSSLEIWVPHESHLSMYNPQAKRLEEFLRKVLEREDIRVQLTAKPDAFPQVKEIAHTSEERWAYLCRKNPLVESLRLYAQGQVLPQEIEIRLPSEKETRTQEET
ncbi:MAG: hypothetical protein N3E49_03460 [Bacteroidia bacterium]|nr:hypothetical protein [Bacteroidia bacterium]